MTENSTRSGKSSEEESTQTRERTIRHDRFRVDGKFRKPPVKDLTLERYLPAF